MITLHFHLQPQYKYELVHVNFTKTAISEVRKALKELKSKKDAGVDGIPSRLLKDGVDALASPLSVILNLTIQQNFIPAEWKKAKVTP